jgi:acetyl esterase/lipase
MPVVGMLTVALIVSIGVVVTRRAEAQITRDERGIVWREVGGLELKLDSFVPEGDASASRPAVLLLHGGGWAGGSRREMRETGRKLADAGFVAFSADYRLAPHNPYPAALEDAQAAIAWMRAPEQVIKYGIDTTRIGAIGSSAGGQLVGLLSTMGEGPLDTGTRLRAAVSWSGAMLFWPLAKLNGPPLSQSTINWWLDSVVTYLGCNANGLGAECADLAADASPLNHVDPTDTPMLLANGSREIVPETEATTMSDALATAGVTQQLVIVKGREHATMYIEDVWADTLAFLRAQLGSPA